MFRTNSDVWKCLGTTEAFQHVVLGSNLNRLNNLIGEKRRLTSYCFMPVVIPGGEGTADLPATQRCAPASTKFSTLCNLPRSVLAAI